MKLADKVSIITGGAKGIGFGCAKVFCQHGGQVVIADKDEPGGRAAVQSLNECGGQTNYLRCDVTCEADMYRVIDGTVEKYGKLDCIVNNAGWHPPPMTIDQTSVTDFEAQLRLNLTSTFMGCKFAVPHLRKTKGNIVIIASEVAVIGQTEACAYAASKAGQIGLVRALALDLAPEGIRVNAVCPSTVMTPLMREWAASLPNPDEALRRVEQFQPGGRMATIEEMGEVCAFLASNEASFVTGQAIVADGGAMLGYGIKGPEVSDQ